MVYPLGIPYTTLPHPVYNSTLANAPAHEPSPLPAPHQPKMPSDNADIASLGKDALEQALLQQADLIKGMKAQKPAPSKEDLAPFVERLQALKAALAKLAEDTGSKFDRAVLESLLIKRFFYAPSFQIYGGVAGLYDYGPPGAALQNNILQLWRQHFVLEEDMLEIECTNLTPEAVFKTSGHVDRFTDWMVRDVKTGDIFRADHLVKQILKERLEANDRLKRGVVPDKKSKKPAEPLTPETVKEYENILEQLDNYSGPDLWKLINDLNMKAPETGNDLSEPVQFNLMFGTQIGPTGNNRGFLRPETAQGHFVNFKKLLEFNTDQMPFASASIGKSFRNEISPRAGLLRVREFTMAEIEHYVDPTKKDHPRFSEIEHIVLPLYSAHNQMNGGGVIQMSVGDAVRSGVINNETLGYFVARIYLFLTRIGIKPDKLRFRQHMSNEMAHYACDCWDAEILNSFGWIECVGCADRSAYDLTAHSNRTGESLVVRERLPEPVTVTRWTLTVNKPKFGPAFKKNAKFVQGYFDTLMVSATHWNEQKLQELDVQIKANGGSATITGTDGNPYVITTDLVTIQQVTETTHVREFTPNVIEPSFGIGRILYSLIEHVWWTRENDEQRHVLSFPPVIAPTKALVLPISKNEEFVPFLKDIVSSLRRHGVSSKVDDSARAIGARYSRNDELGTPFAITVDFQTIKDKTVTLRERDTLKQIRESIPTVTQVIRDLVEETTTWEQVLQQYPAFEGQEI
ncbi:uncharacterized protein BJ171DRAFT_487007 [Polychytrium aggregatum]|uniref:uncharacterized protein n=1 Tax=Polychytrium aggregatum TaxID=110093 RepID=UPI0022FEDA66|nr:uncharacterized protein BJ171DRAFT_487007 [Polychytrium aggregatum]KAI9209444.1 hypothetical protein BJ171DRAFT_487007 [Polychytrium aggregatum]